MVKSLSVFFPAYNEAGNLETTVNKAVAVLQKLDLNWEILIINDGSIDDTQKIAEELVKKNNHIKLINHEKNLGYGEALKSGFYNSKYEWIAFTDSDGQFDFSEIDKFIEKTDQAEVIVGYRMDRQDKFLRKINGWGWTLISNLLLGINVKDVDCAFKLIKKEAIEKIPKLESTRGGMISPELLAKLHKKNFKIIEVGVHHFPRKTGAQTGANMNVILTSFLELFKLWWKLLNKKEFFSIILILGLAAFLRLYKIDQYMTFLGDEGRDALIVEDFLVNHHIPFIGPPTSIGNIYLGPLYYYLMAIPMAIFWLNPLAAAIQIAIISVLTVYLIWYLGKLWFGPLAGGIGAFLYAISPITIIYGRSSWNPNPAPFFTMIAVISFYKARKTLNFNWLILTGAAVAATVQMHYLALILVPVFGILWLYELTLLIRRKLVFKNFFSGTFWAIIAFLIVMTPLFIFDIRHDFLNLKAIEAFFLNRQNTVNVNPLNSLARTVPIYQGNLISRYLTGNNLQLAGLMAIILLLPIIIAFVMHVKGKAIRFIYLIMASWLGIGVLGLSLYKQNIYDHYLGFLNPVPYLLLGSLVAIPVAKKYQKYLIGGVLGLCALLVFVNLANSPLQNPPNNQVERTQKIAKFVIADSGNKPFNFALLAKSNYDSAYQFYLGIYGHKPKALPAEITDQLFVVCEDPDCQPVNNPKYEIAAFGWVKIDTEQEFEGVKVYRLVHNTDQKAK